ncbi:MAG: Fis family transcriptional regulator [Xanthomonadales bacterium]|nr:Fis family transcriptional regulator [Xanthomonadales bacterium]NIN60319.1 Fis family transcriptional regulator [Xanthomonadales bacterium]NIN75671.1 Fis family transcriptional regulator [Xanthomonadales bacterium]NIO14744.1 Fis family transcriptional regulator [Xanthomonadales bacterium]NIP12712.1 Fis family transcriptional regulator [Xanthomonadales bacterium]
MATKTEHVTPLRRQVQKTIRRYLKDMGSTEPEHVHRKLMTEIEPPLIEEVLNYTRGNQSRAARILGMTRNTLRTRLRRYGISYRK